MPAIAGSRGAHNPTTGERRRIPPGEELPEGFAWGEPRTAEPAPTVVDAAPTVVDPPPPPPEEEASPPRPKKRRTVPAKDVIGKLKPRRLEDDEESPAERRKREKIEAEEAQREAERLAIVAGQAAWASLIGMGFAVVARGTQHDHWHVTEAEAATLAAPLQEIFPLGSDNAWIRLALAASVVAGPRLVLEVQLRNAAKDGSAPAAGAAP